MNGIYCKFAARTIYAAAALGLMLAAASAAGTPPPAAPPPDVKALFNPAVPDDPAKVALAKEFIQLYHPRIDMQHVVMMIDKGMPRAIEAAKHRDPKVDVKKFEQDTRARMMTGAEKSLDRQAHVVSRHFSEQELKDLIAFCKGPLGQKLAETTEHPARNADDESGRQARAHEGQATDRRSARQDAGEAATAQVTA